MLKDIAGLIWENGTARLHFVMPGEKKSDFIIKNYFATHFILSWVEKGKKVKISFFKADKFGPTKNIGEIIKEKIVNL